MNAILSRPRIRACGAYKHFFAEKILMPGEFTSPEQMKEMGPPQAERPVGIAATLISPEILPSR